MRNMHIIEKKGGSHDFITVLFTATYYSKLRNFMMFHPCMESSAKLPIAYCIINFGSSILIS